MIVAGRHTIIPEDIKCYESVELSFGAFCSIASGLRVISGQHPPVEHPQCVTQFPFFDHAAWKGDYYPSKMGGSVTIGNDVWIGENVTIMEGITIGNGAIIGAGSVVVKDIRPYRLAAGNPAHERKTRFSINAIKHLQEIEWWNWDDEQIKETISLMRNVDLFIDKYRVV